MTSIKPKVLFSLLLIMSIISTVYIFFSYESGVLGSEAVTFFKMPESIGLKEVGFIDFVVNTARKILFFVL